MLGLNSDKNCLQAPQGGTNSPFKSAAMAIVENSDNPWKQNLTIFKQLKFRREKLICGRNSPGPLTDP